MESRLARFAIRAGAVLCLAFLYVPILIIVVYAFNGASIQTWPPANFTTHWVGVAWHDREVRSAFVTSMEAAIGAATIALLLGTTAAFAVHRFKFFGRNTISFALVLPIALPGVVTGLALNSAIGLGHSAFGLQFSLLTIIIGHATFCIVVVFNNVVARLRRTSGSLVEASMDLGAAGWQTFRYVTFPAIGTALVAGALLAFALSLDEIIVTTFTAGGQRTLPIWIYTQINRGRALPQVNAVALFLLVLSLVPVYFAQRLAGAGERRSGGLGTGEGRSSDQVQAAAGL
ncbi:MAG: ABC transporter permease [Actinomycetota bacterium]|nr:ABC transporter permease [Actinomycetota bacterium]